MCDRYDYFETGRRRKALKDLVGEDIAATIWDNRRAIAGLLHDAIGHTVVPPARHVSTHPTHWSHVSHVDAASSPPHN